MTKTFTVGTLRSFGGALYSVWEADKSKITLSGRSLYNLLALKKTLDQKLALIEETLTQMAIQNGGVDSGDGRISIPPDRRKEAEKAFNGFGNEDIELEFAPIQVGEESGIPLSIYEAIFDFVEFKED